MAAESPALDAEDVEVLSRLADRVVELRLETPAILTLETARPMSFFASQTLVFFEPLVQALFRFRDYQRFTRLLERRDTLELLTRLIEDRAARRAGGTSTGDPPSAA
jgi:hypothetical protein